MALSEEKRPLGKGDFSVEFRPKNLNCVINISYSLEQADELCLKEIFVETDLSGTYLGVLNGYLSLVFGKPVEVLDRLSPKELDYFLRDENSVPAFSYYTKELYEILSVGELIIKQIKGKPAEIEKIFNQGEHGEFHELSFSEQIEFFEEFCSKRVYPEVRFQNIFMDIENIEDGRLVYSSRFVYPNELIEEIQGLFNREFLTNLKFSREG